MKFLQNDPKYAQLSATVQKWAETGTKKEQEALAFYFEKAMRLRLNLPHDTIEKGVTDLNNISVARYEEIKETAADFVNTLFNIVDTTINRAFEKAEQEGMQKLETKLQELEEHGLDDKIEAKLADKEPEYEKALRETFGVENNPVMHVSDLNEYMDKLKKKRES